MAIKVSGTNVITDARALNNITSIDTTTKNAIGNAGVGGKTTLLTDSNIGNVSSVSVSFTGDYDYYMIHLKDVYHNAGATQHYLMARLTNSSGSNITGTGIYTTHQRPFHSSGSGQDVDYDEFSCGYESTIGGVKGTAMIKVINPYSTSITTYAYGTYTNGLNNASYQRSVHFAWKRNITSIERNNSMYFFWNNYINNTNFGGGRLTVWGVSV